MFYDKERVTDARLLDLRVENSGNVAISTDAFEGPMSVPLGEVARVLNRPNVGKTVPPELRPQVSVDGQDLVIAPLLLNAGDSFEVTVLVSQLSDGNRLRARIAGVPKLIDTGTESSEREQMDVTIRRPWVVLPALVGVVALGYSLAFREDPFAHKQSRVVLTSGPPLCGEVLRTDDPKTIVVKLKDTGTLHTVPLARTKAITDDAC